MKMPSVPGNEIITTCRYGCGQDGRIGMVNHVHRATDRFTTGILHDIRQQAIEKVMVCIEESR